MSTGLGQHIILRGKKLVFRRALPAALQQAGCPREYVRTLQSSDIAVGQQLARTLTTWTDNAFAAVLRNLKYPEPHFRTADPSAPSGYKPMSAVDIWRFEVREMDECWRSRRSGVF